MTRTREVISIALVGSIMLAITGLAVHKTDNWYYQRRQEAAAVAAKRDAEAAAKAKEAAHAEKVRVYTACVASQAEYDKQPAAVKAKTTRPVCAPVTN